MNTTMCATMCATVREVCPYHLLVCDHSTDQVVLVHTRNACHFSCGDCVCIYFNGAMTASIPPQITACCIRHVPHC